MWSLVAKLTVRFFKIEFEFTREVKNIVESMLFEAFEGRHF